VEVSSPSCHCRIRTFADDSTGPFLTLFRQKYPEIPVTVFLRSTAYDEALRALDVAIVHGTYADTTEVQQLVSKHSIVVNVGSSWDTALTGAILRGAQVEAGEKKKILIHMSGAGNFVDGGKSGNYVPQEHPFNDANPDDVRKIGPAKLNGAVDELVFKAASAGIINGFVVCPGGIYGLGSENAVTNGTTAPSLGVWASWMVENIINLGFSPYIGEGTAVFPTVHVDDVVQLMFLVFEKALNTWDTYKPEDAYNNFYLGVDERFGAKTHATAFAEYVSETGKLDSVKIKQVTFEESGSVAR
jgi:nucleoside-diphosphate-sugar epimerase